MRRKKNYRISGLDAPFSSHPEAEDGVKIFSAATRRALRQERELPRQKAYEEPIVSIDGRDVEKLPSTKDRAA